MANLLDRMISYISPERALRRVRAQQALRVYEAATPSRRTNSWRSQNLSANSEVSLAIGPLRDRARNMVRNATWGPRLLDIMTAHAVGTGLRPVSNTGDDKLDAKVMAFWEEWNETADIEGMLSFDAMQALAMRSTVESGEVVFRFIEQELKPHRDARVPVKLQLLESDFVDHQRDGMYSDMSSVPTDTQRSRLGIGLGQWDRRTGMWLFPYHPGEMTIPAATATYLSRFVPQTELVHMFRVLRPGQVRGVSWFAPMMMMAGDLADFMDALIVKAKVEACFTAFVTNQNEVDQLMSASPDSSELASAANPDAVISTLEPGMIKELRTGQDIKFANPTSAGQVEPMLMYPLMAMAAAVGATYDQLSGDLRGANYSSLRAGKIDFRRLIEQTQNHMLIPRMARPIWRRFIERAVMAGELPRREGGYPVSWVTPAWESINPKFDQGAEEASVRAGRMPPQEFIGSWGYDWRKVQDQFKEFFDRADKMGLKFDIDPRQMTKAGSLQPQPPQPGQPNGGGSPNGAANGSSADITDQNGNPIDLQQLQDLIDAAEEGGRGFPFINGCSATVSAAFALLAKREYNEEDHPRDELGQWTDAGGGDGGGGAGGNGGGTSSPAPAPSKSQQSPKSGENGIGYEFVSPNVAEHLDFGQAVDGVGGEQQKSLHLASAEINRKLGIAATEHDIVGAWADGAENSVMDIVEKADWDRLELSAAMKGWLADQKSVLIFQQREGGDDALYSFEAKGDISDVHKAMLEDGIGFHTLVPHEGGATVYVAELGDDDLSAQIRKGATRYGSKVTYQVGKAKFVGDSQEGGTDREQRDRARAAYEEVINRSPVSGSTEIWNGIRDRWGKEGVAKGAEGWDFTGGPNGEKWQQEAERVMAEYSKEYPRVKANTTALTKDINTAMLSASNYTDWADWYEEASATVERLFTKEYAPLFERFLAATSINVPVEQSVKLSLRAMVHYLGGGKFETATDFPGTMQLVRDQIKSAIAGEVSGPKVEAFYANFAGDYDQPTIDRWMKVLLFKNPTTSGGQSALPQTRAGQALVRDFAKKTGWKPAQMQAMLWAVTMIMHGKEPKRIDEIMMSKESQEQVSRIQSMIATQKGLMEKRDGIDDTLAVLETAGTAFDNAALFFRFVAAVKETFPEITEVREWNEEDHPRDEIGQFTDAGGGESAGDSGGASFSSKETTYEKKATQAPSASDADEGVSDEASAAAQATPEGTDVGKTAGRPKTKVSDFGGKLKLSDNLSPAQAEAFVANEWDARTDLSPEEFRQKFYGGVNSRTSLDRAVGGRWNLTGVLLDEDGLAIGRCDRIIDWSTKTAISDYFALNSGNRGSDIGKSILAGNIEMYQKMGIEKVRVHANIDVGGYAWAKYGYVPSAESWGSLRSAILRRLGEGGSSYRGGGRSSDNEYTADSWDMVTEDDRNTIFEHYRRDTYDDYLRSEIENWRDNGDALDDAKRQVASDYEDDNQWAVDALQQFAENRVSIGVSELPFTAEQIANAISIEYQDGYSGRGNLTVTFDDDKLTEPKGFDPKQGTLPGIEPVKPHELLTEEMRESIEKVISDEFDERADHVADNLDPPEYFSDSIAEFQEEMWSSMSERDKFRWAESNGYLPSYPIEDDEEDDDQQEELDIPVATERDALVKLAQSNNPKAVWAIADSPRGKELLLNTDWNGTLNLNDKQSMDRFHAYVSRKKAAA